MAHKIGAEGPIRVAIADDSTLIFSDDYRRGWPAGFLGLGVETKVFDIAPLRKILRSSNSAYKSTRHPSTAKDIARHIMKWKPTLVFCHHGRAASNPDFLNVFHKARVRTAVYLCDEPYESGETCKYSPNFKFAFSMDPLTVEPHRLSREGRRNVFYLPPGVDTEHFKYADYSNRTTPAFFLGNASLTPRHEWLKPVARLIDGADIRYFKSKAVSGYKNDKQWVPVEDHPRLYSSCVVGLNVHRAPEMDQNCFRKRVKARNKNVAPPKGITISELPPAKWGTGFWNEGNLPAAHVNPRFLEMAACGTIVVSDNHRSELARMFPMAPQASDPEHFYELVRYYLDHTDEAEAIGRACSTLISKRHSYVHRAAEVLIRVGLMDAAQGALPSSLGALEDWLTPQGSELLEARSSLDQTGPSERWSPAFGMSSIQTSGSPKDSSSLDAPTPWLW